MRKLVPAVAFYVLCALMSPLILIGYIVWVGKTIATGRSGVSGTAQGPLTTASPLFTRLWPEHDVAIRRQARKRVQHPTVGRLELDCEVLLTPEQDQRLILHTAPPGTETAERLDLLRVIGLQALASSR